MGETFDIIINYGNYSYTIPVLSRDDVLEEDLPLLPPPKNAIKFVNEGVNISLRIDENPDDNLMFVNNWDFKLNDIKLNITGRLKEILEIEQDYFETIESNETLITKIYLNKDRNPLYSYYEGYLIIESSSGTLDTIKFSINFELSPDEEVEFNDVECGSEICEEGEGCIDENCVAMDEDERIEEGIPVKEKRNLWWLWALIILIIGTSVFIFSRRKKEVTQSFKDYAEKIKK